MWPGPAETQTLLNQAANGEADAVNRLLQRHRDSLCRMVHWQLDRRMGARLDASDIVQDVLVEAHRRLQEYVRSPQLPFHLWLRHLARDRVIDMRRRHHGAQRRSVDREQPIASVDESASFGLDHLIVDGQLTPAAASLRRELQDRFLQALDGLDDNDREIILMRHCEHLSNTEVAQALSLSPAAAGMRYLRALRQLRSILGEPNSSAGTNIP